MVPEWMTQPCVTTGKAFPEWVYPLFAQPDFSVIWILLAACCFAVCILMDGLRFAHDERALQSRWIRFALVIVPALCIWNMLGTVPVLLWLFFAVFVIPFLNHTGARIAYMIKNNLDVLTWHNWRESDAGSKELMLPLPYFTLACFAMLLIWVGMFC